VTVAGDIGGTTYVSRVLDLPPLVAQAAFDAVRPSDPHGRGILVGGALRVAAREGYRRTSGARGMPYRSQPAVIVVARVRRWAVELELVPWSPRRTELGLFFMGNRLAALPSPSAVAAGVQIVELLRTKLEVWASEPLRAWADTALTPRAGVASDIKRGCGPAPLRANGSASSADAAWPG
jgi:hypothetical protein